jgi:hypothetical protein
VSRAAALTGLLLLLSFLSVAAAFWLSVFTDRQGGVTLLLLRQSPAWPVETFGDSPAHVGRILVRGNENGVMGGDLTRWNAHYGVWLLSGVAATRLWFRTKSRALPQNRH